MCQRNPSEPTANKETCHLYVDVTYDPATTDPDSLATALDRLLETALSTVGILSEYGDPIRNVSDGFREQVRILSPPLH